MSYENTDTVILSILYFMTTLHLVLISNCFTYFGQNDHCVNPDKLKHFGDAIRAYIVWVSDRGRHIRHVVDAVALLGHRRFPGDVFAVRRYRNVDGSVAGGGRIDGKVGWLSWRQCYKTFFFVNDGETK